MFELCMVVSGPPLSMPGRESFLALYENDMTCLACQIAYDNLIESTRVSYNNNGFAIRLQSKTTMIETWFNIWNLTRSEKWWLRKLMYDYDDFWENEIYV